VSQLRLAFTIALAISGCVQRPDDGRVTSRADSQRATSTPDFLPIRRLDESSAAIFRYSSGIRDSTFTTARDLARWEDLWRRLTAQHGPPQSAPPIDFQKEMVLVATMGAQRSGGYTITIESAVDRGAYLEVHVSRRAPGPRCGTIAMLTAPADVAIVPRREVEARMLAHDEITDCDPD
jgi:hypothetical protein